MIESGKDPIDAAQGKRERGWRFYVISGLILLAAIFVFQNTDETKVNFLFAETELPLFFALLIAVLLGALIGWLTPRVRSGKRDEG